MTEGSYFYVLQFSPLLSRNYVQGEVTHPLCFLLPSLLQPSPKNQKFQP